MIQNKNYSFIITVILLFSFILCNTHNIMATAQNNDISNKNDSKAAQTSKLRDPAEFQKIIQDYKEYVAKLPAKVRDETIIYRKKIAKINKQKQLLFNKLSQESQTHLIKEQEYKRKLPLNRKYLIDSNKLQQKHKIDLLKQKINN